MNRAGIAAEYAAQNKPKGSAGNIFYVGRVIYSYGEHFPMAVIRGTRAFFNSDKYSVSTSRQQSAVRSALQRAGYAITERSTGELQALARGTETDPGSYSTAGSFA